MFPISSRALLVRPARRPGTGQILRLFDPKRPAYKSVRPQGPGTGLRGSLLAAIVRPCRSERRWPAARRRATCQVACRQETRHLSVPRQRLRGRQSRLSSVPRRWLTGRETLQSSVPDRGLECASRRGSCRPEAVTLRYCAVFGPRHGEPKPLEQHTSAASCVVR